MKYVEALLKDSSFLYRLFHLAELEKNRAYCRHDLEHFLNTARIAWIFALEKGLSPEKEQIYLAALLHDLGRVEEYEQEISHEEASAAFAGEILRRLGYDEKKTKEICYAVAAHRERRTFLQLKMTCVLSRGSFRIGSSSQRYFLRQISSPEIVLSARRRPTANGGKKRKRKEYFYEK